LSPSIGKIFLIFGGVVTKWGLELLSALDSSYPLSIHIESGEVFIGTSLVTMGWLFQSTIPMLLARILSATGVVYSLVSLFILLV